jgi:putative salt-induced outer membrane protein YdiY
MNRIASFLLLALLAFAPAISRADVPGTPTDADKPNKPWSNQTEISFVSANGNTKSQTLSAKDAFSYTKSKTTLELFGGALNAKDKGASTAENYNAGEKISYKLSERNYTFERVAWDKDRFAGVKSRWDSSVGLGRELIKTPRNGLIAELGGGYLAEDRYNQKSNDFTSGRVYSKYTFAVSPTSNFTQDAEYLHNFDDPDDFRAKTETALTAAISKHFSMKASYVWKYVGVPPVGFGRNDTMTSVALVATY